MRSSCVFFFFKQKTAYEMRISDWSSDVCSSDLRGAGGHAGLRCWVCGPILFLPIGDGEVAALSADGGERGTPPKFPSTAFSGGPHASRREDSPMRMSAGSALRPCRSMATSDPCRGRDPSLSERGAAP